MTLLETVIEVTPDSTLPEWVWMLIGVVLGAAGPWLLKRGYKVTLGKPKAAAMLCVAAAMALTLTGCSMVESLFGGANIDRDLAAQNLRNWQTFDKHLADPDALSPGWVKTAKLLTTDATDTAQRLNDKAQKE